MLSSSISASRPSRSRGAMSGELRITSRNFRQRLPQFVPWVRQQRTEGPAVRSSSVSSRVERSNGRQRAAAHFAAEQRRMRRAEVAAVAEGEAAGTAQAIGVLGLLAMTGRE